jgi:cysteine desulfuration protein SufE
MTLQDQIIKEFQSLATWDERYEKIIEIGRALPMQDNSFKKAQNKVSGCQSRVWLEAELDHEGKVIFLAESDAMLVRGLVALLLRVYSGLTPKQIIETEPYFIEALELNHFLSPTRANGIMGVLKKIKSYAVGFDYLQENTLFLRNSPLVPLRSSGASPDCT